MIFKHLAMLKPNRIIQSAHICAQRLLFLRIDLEKVQSAELSFKDASI